MSKILKLEDTCPKCGRHLISKEGEYGEFLACPRFPACKFTKPLPDGDLKIYPPPSPYCEKCNHTGKIPFVKNGKVISHAFVYCECRKEFEHFYPLRPEDFDFPCSYDWRKYFEYTYSGTYLPPLEPREPLLPEPIISFQPDLPTLRYYKPKHLNWKQVSMWSALFEEQEHRKLLEKKLNEHLDVSKEKSNKYIIK